MIRFLTLILILGAQPAFANHPGERLDEVMAKKEPAFEIADGWHLPELNIKDQNGIAIRLEDINDQIVFISFVPQACGDPCVRQQVLLASVQEQVNLSQMKELVTFVTVQDPETTIDATWEPYNWMQVLPSDGSTIVSVVERFSAQSSRDVALPMGHVLDRNGRYASVFHGTEFKKTNMTLYANGLVNNAHTKPDAHTPSPPNEKNWWDWLTDLFK